MKIPQNIPPFECGAELRGMQIPSLLFKMPRGLPRRVSLNKMNIIHFCFKSSINYKGDELLMNRNLYRHLLQRVKFFGEIS